MRLPETVVAFIFSDKVDIMDMQDVSYSVFMIDSNVISILLI